MKKRWLVALVVGVSIISVVITYYNTVVVHDFEIIESEIEEEAE